MSESQSFRPEGTTVEFIVVCILLFLINVKLYVILKFSFYLQFQLNRDGSVDARSNENSGNMESDDLDASYSVDDPQFVSCVYLL